MQSAASRLVAESEKTVYRSLNTGSAMYLFLLQTMSSKPLSLIELRRKCRESLPSCRGLSKVLYNMVEQGYADKRGEGYILQGPGIEIGKAIRGFKRSLRKFVDDALKENITAEKLLAELMAVVASTVSVSFLGKENLEAPLGLPLHGYISMMLASVLSNAYPHSRTLREALGEVETLILGVEGEE